jgi:dihydroneopterin aldolase
MTFAKITNALNKTKIELKDLAFFARHGVLNEEAKLGQRFKVDVLLTLVDGLEFEDDTPEQTVNYVEVYDVVQEIFTGFRFNLIERAAEVIATEMLERFDKAVEVTVKVKKPSVPVDCICDYFAAEVTRCR